MAGNADFDVLESTLDRFALHMQFVFGDPEVRVENVEDTCKLLIQAAQNPDLAEDDRVMLYRLSDLLHFAFTGSYLDLEVVQDSNSRRIPCNVPTRDALQWQDVLQNCPQVAHKCDVVARHLQDLNQHLPLLRAGLPQEHFWLIRASALVGTCGILMRRHLTAT